MRSNSPYNSLVQVEMKERKAEGGRERGKAVRERGARNRREERGMDWGWGGGGRVAEGKSTI